MSMDFGIGEIWVQTPALPIPVYGIGQGDEDSMAQFPHL